MSSTENPIHAPADAPTIETEASEVTSKDVARAMIELGGGFISALGYALLKADEINTLRIRHTFAEYWHEYEEWARKGAGKIIATVPPPTKPNGLRKCQGGEEGQHLPESPKELTERGRTVYICPLCERRTPSAYTEKIARGLWERGRTFIPQPERPTCTPAN